LLSREVISIINLVTKLFNTIAELQKNKVDTLADEVQEKLKEGLPSRKGKGFKGGKGGRDKKDRRDKDKKGGFLKHKF
jgi:hypothetical protein